MSQDLCRCEYHCQCELPHIEIDNLTILDHRTLYGIFVPEFGFLLSFKPSQLYINDVYEFAPITFTKDPKLARLYKRKSTVDSDWDWMVKKYPTSQIAEFKIDVSTSINYISGTPAEERYSKELKEYTQQLQLYDTMSAKEIDNIPANKWKKFTKLRDLLRSKGLIV